MATTSPASPRRSRAAWGSTTTRSSGSRPPRSCTTRLEADEIPLGAQIVFICDAFAAMTTDGSYKEGMSESDALAELQLNAGTQFAPAVVAAFAAEYASSAIATA